MRNNKSKNNDAPCIVNSHIYLKLGYRATDLSRRPVFSQPSVSISVKRGEKISKTGKQQFEPDIPVILCTGYSARIDEQQAMAVGIREFVLKPVVRQQIATAIRKVLDAN